MQLVPRPESQRPFPETAPAAGRLANALTNGHARPVPKDRLARACDLLGMLLTGRWIDRIEMELIHRGEGFFHVSGAGHESTAALAAHLGPQDWLHLHYRDKALMAARGLRPRAFFDALLCNADSWSAGRGMCAHPNAVSLNLLSLAGPVGNSALQAVGVAQELADRQAPGNPVTVCAFGDGTTQQGEVLEAIGEAVRSRLPVLFIVEDNRYAISTTTAGRTFYDRPDGQAAEFYGIPIVRIDGRDPLACDVEFSRIIAGMRRDRGPVLVLLQVERLTHHTNADDERIYREDSELDHLRETADPIRVLSDQLRASGVSQGELERIEADVEERLRADAEASLRAPQPVANLDARLALPAGFPAAGTTGTWAGGPLTLLEAMKEALRHHLAVDPRVSLFGQDIEDPKGDVFGLTRGLTRQFPGRVRNAPLSESTIAGVSIGRALAGGRPVGFIQFADFLPLAYNQIASELGSIHWRSNGEWSAPVILLSPCGGYRPGLGPFHANTFESTYAHVPGLDVFMPSNAEDAAGLLNAAFASGRPTLFLYPKVLLNDPTATTRSDPTRVVIRPGTARIVTEGDDLTLVSWGATVPLCRRAVDALAAAGVKAGLIDLRTLAPWDRDAVVGAVRRSRRLIVVHEDNHTCGFGAEVAATVAEHAGVPVAVRRITRPDTYVPCNYANQLEVLPSLRRILTAAADLCGLEATFEIPPAAADGVHVLEAVGSSPADQNVTVLEWKVKEGARIRAGDLVAECEADKATFDLRAPVSGRLHALIPVGEQVRVGDALARIQPDSVATGPRRIPVEPRPVLRRRAPVAAPPVQEPAAVAGSTAPRPVQAVTLSGLSFVTGSRVVTNEELVSRFPGRTPRDIVQRTGIERRHYCAAGEDALTLATAAARRTLSDTGLTLADLDAIYVSTSTPLAISPSLACRLHHSLSQEGPSKDMPACDISAACSGYLYALQAAFDVCQSRPASRILVVTAEAMSRFLNQDDFDTAIVFGDAATATLVCGPDVRDAGDTGPRIRLRRPVLSARGEDGSILNMGRMITGGACAPVEMDGLKVFPIAVRQMPAILERACAEAGVALSALDWIVPHQANGRIIAAVQRQTGLPEARFVSNVARYGNTSSSTIPIALAEMLAEGRTGLSGLCAFGGGFTFGAALATLEPSGRR